MVSRQPSVGLKASAKDLRAILEKSGCRHKTEGAEKLDFVVWLAEQVKGSVEEGRKMKLTVKELAAFLQREGVADLGATPDVKTLISGLLSLRCREVARLSYDADKSQAMASGDNLFNQSLALMTIDQVNKCFDVAIYEGPPPGAIPEESAPPGQVNSPREQVDPLSATLLSDATIEPNTNEVPHLREAGRSQSANTDASNLLPPPPPSIPPPAPPDVPKIPEMPEAKKGCCSLM